MPKCEGRPNDACPEQRNDGTVTFTQGDLWLCNSCEQVRFPDARTTVKRTTTAGRGKKTDNKGEVLLKADQASVITEDGDVDPQTLDVVEAHLSRIMAKILPDLMVKMVDKFESCLARLVGTFEEKLKDRFDYVSSEVVDTNIRIDRLEKELKEREKERDDVKSEFVALKKQFTLLEDRLEEQEQYVRRENLIFYGIDETTDENTTQKVIDICHRHFPTVNLSLSDISTSHRLPTKNGRTKPIIVRFARREPRQQIYYNKKNLKGTRITVAEHLTNKRSKLMMTAVDLTKARKLVASWSRDGRIMIKLFDGSIREVTSAKDITEAVGPY